MKIIINENNVEKIKSLIDKKGIKKVITLMGGPSNFIKMLGRDDIEKYIYQYLDENWYPDYGWQSPEDYKEEVERFGETTFYVNDRLTLIYTENENGITKLEVYPSLYNEMEEVFSMDGDVVEWIKLIADWFEKSTGLKVGFVE